MSKNRYSISSVLRALNILKLYSFDKTEFTNKELSEELGLNKSTVTALLSSLDEGGFLEKDEKTRGYRLTHLIYRLGRIYINQIDLHKVAIPLLTELAVYYNESVHIGFLNKFKVYNMDSIESTQPVGIRISKHISHDAHSSAIGKVLLAYLDQEEIEDYFQTVNLRRYTSNTITSKVELRNHLLRVKENGYALDDGELFEDVRCVGAPVYDSSGKVIAAISISGPVFRMTREKIERAYISAVREVSMKISQKLGYLHANHTLSE